MGKKSKKKKSIHGESMIEHLGGEEQMKVWGTSIMMFANMIDKLIIVDGLPSMEVKKRCCMIMKMGEDMRKGQDNLLDEQAVFADTYDEYDDERLPFY